MRLRGAEGREGGQEGGGGEGGRGEDERSRTSSGQPLAVWLTICGH